MGFSDGTFTRALTAAAVGSRSPIMQSVREGSGDATLQTILFIFLPSIHIRHRIGCGVVNIWQRLCTAEKGEMPRRWKEGTRVERENGILAVIIFGCKTASRKVHLYRRRPEERLRTGEEWSNAIAIYAEPSDACLLSCALWLATTTSLVKMCCFTQASFALNGMWNPSAM